MSLLAGMGATYDAQRQNTDRLLREETEQRNMARMRRTDREQVLNDRERDSNADVLRTLPPSYGDIPDARDIPMNADEAAGGAGISVPKVDRGRVTAPKSKPGIYDNPNLLANQTEAETQRLARMRAPGNFNRMPGAEPVPLPNTPALIKQRADEIRKLNPAGEGVGVNPLIGGSNSDADAIARLKATNAAIMGRTTGLNQYDKPTPYDDTINAAAKQHGIDATVLKRLLGTESSFNPNAVGTMTPQGQAHGIAQIMTDIHGVSPAQARDPAFAIPFAAQLLAQNLRKTGGNYEQALQMYKGAVSAKGKADMAGPIQQILGGQAAQATPAAPVGTPSAAPQQQASNRQFAPGQFFASVPQVDEQARLAQFQMDQISQLAQNTREPKNLAVLQQKYSELQQQVREAELYKLGARADTDVAALSQLVQLAGINIARTPTGFVEVDASGKATSAMMTQSELAQKLFQFTSITARQQAAARSAKVFDARLKVGGELAVQQAKNQGQMQNTELEVLGRVQQELVKAGVDARSVKMNFDPATGKAYVTQGSQVFEYMPGEQTPFGTTPAGFKPVAINQ